MNAPPTSHESTPVPSTSTSPSPPASPLSAGAARKAPAKRARSARQAMRKLRDLASLAGRWTTRSRTATAGATAAPPLATRTIEADRFDEMQWRETFDQAPALRQLVEDLSQRHHYASDLVADVWTAAYKSAPQVRAVEQVDPSRTVNRQVCQQLLDTPEFQRLRRETVGDAFAAAVAVLAQGERLDRVLEHTSQAQAAAEAAQQTQQAADAHAARVAQALEQASAAAGDDGTVPADQVQPLLEAIEQAELADQHAQNTAQQAQQLLAQAMPAAQATLRAGAARATEQIQADKQMAASWGLDPGQLQRLDFASRAALAQRLSGGRMAAFTDLIGRFRQLAAAERTRRLQGVPGELVGVTLGDDLGRLTGGELVGLAVAELRPLFAVRLAEGRLLVHDQHGQQPAGKGPIVACVDCSGSMTSYDGGDGSQKVTREAWAKACTLALLDQARAGRRAFVAVLFSSADQVEVFAFPADRPVAPHQVADLAEHFFDGGTDFQAPLDAATDILQTAFTTSGTSSGDIVFITDGECDVEAAWLERWRAVKATLGFQVFGVSIASRPGPVLQQLADQTHTIADLTDPGTTRRLFHTL